jgi:hypothetical protein
LFEKFSTFRVTIRRILRSTSVSGLFSAGKFVRITIQQRSIPMKKVSLHQFNAKIALISIIGLSLAIMMVWSTASGAPQAPKGNNRLKVAAAEFDPQHDCDASAAWVKNIGLTFPDDRVAFGFLMHKLCSTDFNAASFGLISGAAGQALIGPDAIGFDYKNFNAGFQAHCGAGAPRFNVSMSDGSFHFLGGCSNGTQTPSPRGTGWTQVRFNPQDPTQCFPPIPTNTTIVSISLVFDEGSETPGLNGSPEIVLDNIFINGRFATRP